MIDHEVIVNLIGNTTTRASLTIQATLDQNTYPTGIVVTDCDLGAVNLTRAKFHGKDWNYAINPGFMSFRVEWASKERREVRANG